jgi:hypothetical protein
MIGFFFLIESPRWLMHNNKREKGIANLARLRNIDRDTTYLREEITQIDQALEMQASTSLLTTGIFGVIKTVMTLVWIMVMIDQLGRRKLLMFGALGGAFSLFIVGGYIAVAKPAQQPKTTLDSGGTMAMAFFYIYTIFYTPSWSGTPWVITAKCLIRMSAPLPKHVLQQVTGSGPSL